MRRTVLALLFSVLLCLLLVACAGTRADEDYAYSLTLYVDGEVYRELVSDSTDIAFPKAPERAHYVFDGWYWDEALTDPCTPESMADRLADAPSRNVYSKWRGAECVVNSPERVGFSSVRVCYQESFTLPVPTDSEYLFLGWYCKDGGAEIMLTDAEGVGIGVWSYVTDTDVYPKYSTVKRQQTVTFNSNGGSAVNSISVKYGAPLGTLPSCIRRGYQFLGWYTSSGEKVTSDTVFNDLSMKTLRAKWEAISYEVYFYINGEGGEPTVYKQTYGKAYVLPAAPQKTGYTFEGWVDQKGNAIGENYTNFSVVERWYPTFTPNSYNVTYYGFGNEQTSLTVTFGQRYPTFLNQPFVPGYVFKGYYTEPNGQGTEIKATSLVSIARAHALYASYEPDENAVATLENALLRKNLAYSFNHTYVDKHDVFLVRRDSSYVDYFIGYDADGNELYRVETGGLMFAVGEDYFAVTEHETGVDVSVFRITDGTLCKSITFDDRRIGDIIFFGDYLIHSGGYTSSNQFGIYHVPTGKNVDFEKLPSALHSPNLILNERDGLLYVDAGTSPDFLAIFSIETGECLYLSEHGDFASGIFRFDGVDLWHGTTRLDPETAEAMTPLDLTVYGADMANAIVVAQSDTHIVLSRTSSTYLFGLSRPNQTYLIFDKSTAERVGTLTVGDGASCTYLGDGQFVVGTDGIAALYRFPLS